MAFKLRDIHFLSQSLTKVVSKAKCGEAEHFRGLWEFNLHCQWARREEELYSLLMYFVKE